MNEADASATQTAQQAQSVTPQSPKAAEIQAVGADLMARQNDKTALAPRRNLLESDLAQLRALSPHIKVNSLVQDMAALDMKSGALEPQIKALEARVRALIAEAEAELRRQKEEQAAKEAQGQKQAQQPKPASGTKTLLKVGAAAMGTAMLARALTPRRPPSRGLVRRPGAYANLLVQEGPAPRPVRRNALVWLAGGSRARVSPLIGVAGLAGTLAAFSAVAAMAAPSSSSSPSPAPGG